MTVRSDKAFRGLKREKRHRLASLVRGELVEAVGISPADSQPSLEWSVKDGCGNESVRYLP